MRRDGTLIYLPTHKPCKRSPRQLDGFSKSTVVLDLDAYAACPTSSKVEALPAIPIQTSTTLTQQHQLKAIRRQQEFQIKRAEKARAGAELTMLNAESTDKRQLELRLGIMREEVALVLCREANRADSSASWGFWRVICSPASPQVVFRHTLPLILLSLAQLEHLTNPSERPMLYYIRPNVGYRFLLSAKCCTTLCRCTCVELIIVGTVDPNFRRHSLQ